jgi:hypothetical protein
MNLKSIVAILAVTAAPSWAHAQNAVSKADAQEVIEIISGDEGKIQAYCDTIKLSDQAEQADQQGESTDELSQQIDELAEKLGPEYVALRDAFHDIDLNTAAGQEAGQTMQATIDALNKLCGPRRTGRD